MTRWLTCWWVGGGCGAAARRKVAGSPRCLCTFFNWGWRVPNGLSAGVPPPPAAATHPPACAAGHPACLQDLQARGMEVLLPVGCSDYDEWLLDALSVERLLKQLRSGATKLDLINACVSSSTSGSRPAPPPPASSRSHRAESA